MSWQSLLQTGNGQGLLFIYWLCRGSGWVGQGTQLGGENWNKIPPQGEQNTGMNCCQLKEKWDCHQLDYHWSTANWEVLPTTGRDCQLGGTITNWDGLPPGVLLTHGNCHQLEWTAIKNCCQLGKKGGRGCHQLQGRNGVLSWQDQQQSKGHHHKRGRKGNYSFFTKIYYS